MANLKTARSNRFFQFAFSLFMNMRAKFALADGIEKRARFIFLSVNLKFHATVNQVPYPAGDIETFRNVPNRPAKADTLNIAFVKYLERDHAMRPN